MWCRLRREQGIERGGGELIERSCRVSVLFLEKICMGARIAEVDGDDGGKLMLLMWIILRRRMIGMNCRRKTWTSPRGEQTKLIN